MSGATIDGYQIETMRLKDKLNFEECLNEISEEKSEFNKKFRAQLDIFINEMLYMGISFHGFTINFPQYINKEVEAWKFINFHVENFIMLSRQNIELIEFIYLSIEKHELILGKNTQSLALSESLIPLDILKTEKKKLTGLPHIHGIIGIRNLVNKNKTLITRLMHLYNEIYTDILLKSLGNFKQIKGYWNYVIKENNYKFHRFLYFSQFYENLFCDFIELEISLFKSISYWGLGFSANALYNNIAGIKSTENSEKGLLLYLINLHMIINNIYIYNNDFYTKIERSKFSWKLLNNNLNYLKDNAIDILLDLINKFPQQLKVLNVQQLILNNLEAICADIYKNNKYVPHIKLNNSIIEFLDGLYFLDYDHFFEYRFHLKRLNNLKANCFNYFKTTFNYAYKNKPEKWLNALLPNFENDRKKLDEFCANLGRYFHSTHHIDIKKKTICIIGGSNTGKTTLVANIIIIQALGLQNIGIIGKTKDSFAFEQIEDKQVIICDEFKYTMATRSDLLKVLDNEPILMNKKGITKKLYVNKAPVLFIFNSNIKNKILEDQAFINRLLIYTFSYQISTPNNEMKTLLKNELSSIMLYCNKLYFKNLSSQEFTKKNNRISKKLKLKILEQEN